MSEESVQFDQAPSMRVEKELSYCKNIPISSSKNIPLSLSAQCDGGFSGYGRRRYTRAEQVEKLAIDKYKKNGMGITFNDLLSNGLASHKAQSQITLKHYHRNGTLFGQI